MLYEWLKDYQQLEQDIDYIEYKLDKEKRELKRWSAGGDLGGQILNEKSIASGLEDRIELMEHELANKLNDLYDARKLISRFKGLENQILYSKYVEGKKLITIAGELDFSPNYIYNKHAEIIKRIDFANIIKS